MKRILAFMAIMSVVFSLFMITPVSAQAGDINWDEVWSGTGPLSWLVAGDSITSDVYVSGWKTYDDYISYALNVEKGRSVNFIKTAVPGYKVEDLVNNFDNLIGRYKTDIVSVFIGTNNQTSEAGVFKVGLQSLMDMLVPSEENIGRGVPSDRIILLLGTIPKQNGFKLTSVINDTMAVAAQYKDLGYRVQYIDLISTFDNLVFGTPPNLGSLADYYVDIYHLNGYGHLEVAKRILSQIGLQSSGVNGLKASEIAAKQGIPYFAFDYSKASKKSDGTQISPSLTARTDYTNLYKLNDYNFFVIIGGDAAVSKGTAGTFKNFEQLVRQNIRTSYNKNRVTNLSGTGYSTAEIAANIDSLVQNANYVFIMPEIRELYTGDGVGAPTLEQYSSYMQTIINRLKAADIPFTVLTPTPSKIAANNALLEQYADVAISAIEAAKAADSTLKASVCNVFNVLKDITAADIAQNWFDSNGYLVDSAQNVIYNAFVGGTSTSPVLGMMTSSETLAIAKTAALNELNAALLGYNETDYMPEYWAQLNAAKAAGESAINAATTVDDVTAEKNAALAAMKRVKTKAQLGLSVVVSGNKIIAVSPISRVATMVVSSFNGAELVDSMVFDGINFVAQKPQVIDIADLAYSSLSDVKIIVRDDLVTLNNAVYAAYSSVDTSGVSDAATVNMLFPENKKKALTLSYDDGVTQDRKLVEIFDRYGIKATFNLCSGLLGSNVSGNPTVSASEVKKLYANHEVAGHGYNHTNLTTVSSDRLKELVNSDNSTLKALVGYDIAGLAYPGGAYNDTVVSTLRDMGVQYARTIGTSGNFAIPADFLKWSMTCHHGNANLSAYLNDFLADDGNVKLFSVWGHSYEFDANDNWNLIEDFCAQVSNNSDVWYATNREVVDYVNAYRNLVYYEKNCYVYNPSEIDVYVNVNGEDKHLAANALTVIGGVSDWNGFDTLTDDQLYKATANAAIKKLNLVFSGYRQEDYSANNWSILAAQKAAGERAIQDASTADEVTVALNDAITAMDAVKTLAETGVQLDYNNSTVTVTTPFSKTATVIVASFDKNKMIDARVFSDIELVDGVPQSFDVSGLRTADTGTVKVMLWNDMSSLKPLTVAKAYYRGNVFIAVEGNIDSGQNKMVTMLIRGPNNDIVYFDQAFSGINGRYSFRVIIPADAPPGTYTVKVGEKDCAKSEYTFEVLRY